MNWNVPFASDRISLHVEGRVSAEDAARQMRTAQEVLRRLAEQPGLVLADEVGMGKTYVALAVAASVAWAERRARPVIVMVPPALPEKWKRDAETFVAHCVRLSAAGETPALRCEVARTGLQLFRLLDDPPRTRARVIFLSHGAMHSGLADPWVELAMVRLAMRKKRLRAHRKVFHRFAGRLIQTESRIRDPDVYRALLRSPVRKWRAILEPHDPSVDDDPVPLHVHRALRRAASKELVDALEALPLRRSESVHERIRDVRRALREPLRRAWFDALANARFSSPLLVLDEAHHVKNPGTRLASLLVEPGAEEDAALLGGALAGRFERMLFMTATPFQLGHQELLNVLGRFDGIRWPALGRAPTRVDFGSRMEELGQALDRAHLATTELDARWARLDAREEGIRPDDPEAVEAWWRSIADSEDLGTSRVAEVRRLFDCARNAVRGAETALRPWIIRHLRARTLPGTEVARRERLIGASIHPSGTGDAGVPISDGAVLPFLLAARLQTALTRAARLAGENASRTQTFAEGLASSFEAFSETRVGGARTDDEAVDEVGLPTGSHDPHSDAVRWYGAHLRAALPDRAAFGAHPKVTATVARVLDLWKRGEKVLVFCHWRATGRALERHISAALEEWIVEHSAGRLRCAREDARGRLEALRRRFDPGEQMAEAVEGEVRQIARVFPTLAGSEGRIAETVRQFARLPAFLARFFPLEAADERNAMARALTAHDASGLAFRQKIERFCRFLDERPELLEDYLAALEGVRKRERASDAPGHEQRLLPNVQVVNGGTSQDQRRATLLAFNSPFLPEVLIASSVMAEGVDLHLDCRHVLHHDLDWNPSTLEQRTGRVDRIGAKAEQVGRSVTVFLPFVAATQDEKMYRVVTDRERWFQVMMGEAYRLDGVEGDTSNVVPLPLAAAAALRLDLAIDAPGRRPTLPSPAAGR